MKKYFSISEAAKMVRATSETLRHYDRIGLVKPSCRKEWTNYRYYSEQDVVRLQTVRALQKMDLSLQEVKQVLEYDDLTRIVDFLTEAEKKADEKIADLQYSKTKIQAAKADYENKLKQQSLTEKTVLQYFPKRVIMLSDTLEAPSLENLWNYLKHFYDALAPGKRERFVFEDTAGIYTENGVSKMYAVCLQYENADRLKTLPAGNYLCAGCTEENRKETINEFMGIAKEKYHTEPAFIVQQIVVSGILQWNYQIQICVKEEKSENE